MKGSHTEPTPVIPEDGMSVSAGGRPYTPQIVRQMEAGREMDRLVAQLVMGWLVVVPDGQPEWYDRQVTRWPCVVQWLAAHLGMKDKGGQSLFRDDSLPSGADQWFPSEKDADALEVLKTFLPSEPIRRLMFRVGVHAFAVDDDKLAWLCQIDETEASAPTLALAICRCAVIHKMESK